MCLIYAIQKLNISIFERLSLAKVKIKERAVELYFTGKVL